MEHTWQIIANPRSGGGKLKKKEAYIIELLKQANIKFVWQYTQGPLHAMQLAESLCRNGMTRIISAGGDGTFHEVINGVMQSGVENAIVGAIFVGTGNDWAKSFNYPIDFKGCISRIAREQTMLHDVGLATFSTPKGTQSRYFINIAGLCYDAFVNIQTNQGKAEGKGGKFFYLKTILANLFSYPYTKVTLSTDDATYEEVMFNLCVGINKFNGDGVKQCPDALPDDGLLNVTAYHNLSKWELISQLPYLQNGKFIHHPKVKTFITKKVEVRSEPPVLVEADGEDLGSTPATFTVLPRAIRVIV